MDKVKINIMQVFLSILISALIGYAFYYFANDNNLLLGLVSGILLAIIGLFVFAINFKNEKKKFNTKVLSSLFFFFIFFANLIFVFINFVPNVYLIVNGSIFLIYLIIFTNLIKAKQ